MSTVLVIDDEQSFLVAMDYALSSAGHVVFLAQSGEEGLAMISVRKPDLVILDIMMPGLGGFGTLEAIRSNPETAGLPVIMVSGARPRERRTKPLWDAFLPKPFTRADLLFVIKEILGS